MTKIGIGVLAGAVLLSACGSGGSPEGAAAAPAPSAAAGPGVAQTITAQRFPDVQAAILSPAGDGSFTVAVTVSSPYDSPARYADGWRVLGAGTTTVLGVHELTHDHASEQPFVREQSGLRIPAEVTRITVEGRDQANGYGGATVTIPVPR